MSQTIDERIVGLRFDNQQFESGVAVSLGTIGKLKDGLNFDGLSKGIEQTAGSVGEINNKMGLFGAAGFTVMNRLTNAAIDMGVKMKSAIMDPLIEGGKNRALAIAQAKFQLKGLGQNVEAIMDDVAYAVDGTSFALSEGASAAAMFAASGVKEGKQMKNALRGISGVAAMAGSSYSDVANVFTKVAGQGRLMGDDLNRLASRGINAAATLGEQLNMTEKEVRELVGKGGVSFDMFSKAMNKAFGKHATKANETYRGSLDNVKNSLARLGEKFFTPYFKAMIPVNNAIREFINALSTKLDPAINLMVALMKKGTKGVTRFFKALNPEKDAKKIKGLPGMIRRVFSQLYGIIVAFTKPVKKAWREVFGKNNEILKEALLNIIPAKLQGDLQAAKEWFLSLFKSFSFGEGIGERVQSIFVSVFNILLDGINTVSRITNAVYNFIRSLVLMVKNSENTLMIVGIFAKGFQGLEWVIERIVAIIQIAAAYIAEFVSQFLDGTKPITGFISELTFLQKIFGAIGMAIGVVLTGITYLIQNTEVVTNAIGKFANWVEKLAFQFLEFIKKTNIFEKAAIKIVSVINMIITKIKGLPKAISETSKEFSVMGVLAKGVNFVFDKLAQLVGFLAKQFNKLKASVKGAASSGDALEKSGFKKSIPVMEILKSLGSAIASGFKKLAKISNILDIALMNIAKTLTSQDLVHGGFAVAMLAFAKSFKDFKKQGADLTKSFKSVAKKIEDTLDVVTESLKTMQSDLKSKILKQIAMSILMIAIAVAVLANTDTKKLAIAMGAITILFGELFAMMTLMSKKIKGNFKSMGTVSAAIVLLSFSLLILALAVKTLSGMSIKETATAVVALSVMLATMIGAVILLAKQMDKLKNFNPKSLYAIGFGMMIMAAALFVLAKAMQQFAGMSWEEIGKGLVGVGVGLAFLAGTMYALSKIEKNLLSSSLAILILSLSLIAMAKAVLYYSKLDLQQLAIGLAKVAMVLVVLGYSLNTLPTKNIVQTAVAIGILAFSLIALSKALIYIAGLDLLQMARGLGIVAGMIVVLGAAMSVGKFSLDPKTAAALLLLSFALSILAGSLLLMSLVPMNVLVVVIVALAAGMMVLAAAGILLEPVIVVIVALAGAMALLGLAVALFGGGLLLFSMALASFAASMVAYSASMGQLMETVRMVVLMMAVLLVDALEHALARIAEKRPEFVAHITEILDGILEVIQNTLPTLIEVILDGLLTLMVGLEEYVPQLAELGLKMLIGLLEAIRDNIYEVTTTAYEIMIEFMRALREKLPGLIKEGWALLLALINGMADSAEENMPKLVAAVFRLGKAIIFGIKDGIYAEYVKFKIWVGEKFQAIIDKVKEIFGIASPSKVFKSIGGNVVQGLKNGLNVINKVKEWWGDKVSKLKTKVENTKLGKAGKALVGGLNKGMGVIKDTVTWWKDKVGELKTKAEGVNLTSAGSDLVAGLTSGISEKWGTFKTWFGEKIDGLKTKAYEVLKINSPSKVFMSIGASIMEGLALGLKKSTRWPEDVVTSTANSLYNILQGVLGDVPDTLSKQFKNFNRELTASLKKTQNDSYKAYKNAKKTSDKATKDRQKAEKELEKLEKKKPKKKKDETDKAYNKRVAQWKKEVKEKKKEIKNLKKTETSAKKTTAAKLKDYKNKKVFTTQEKAAYNKAVKKEAALEKKRKAADKKVKKAEKAYGKNSKQAKAARAERDKIRKKERAAEKEVKAAKKKLNAAKKSKKVTQYEKQMAKLEKYQNRMIKLEEKQTELNEQLEEAQAKYEEIAAYQDDITNSFVELAKLSAVKGARTMGEYVEGLRDNLVDAQTFADNIQKLASMGIRQEVIDEIMSQGISTGLETTQYLLDGATAELVAEINSIYDELEALGKSTGNALATQFFGMGADTALGIVQGLESQLDKLAITMEKVGNQIAEAFEKIMAIKSPSRRMAKDGVQVISGLIVGINKMQTPLRNSIKETGNVISDEMGKVIDIMDYLDIPDPEIKPFLNLDDFNSGIRAMNNMIGNQAIAVGSVLPSQQVQQDVPVESNQNGTTEISKQTTIIQNFNDRVATPSEIYNAAKFGSKVGG